MTDTATNTPPQTLTHARYPAYKDSGVDWLGEIPAHWEVWKLKYLFTEKKHTTNQSLNCGSISFGRVVTKDDEKIPDSTKASYQEVLSGEFLINPLNLNYDLISLRIALSYIDVVVSPGYIVLRSIVEINREFFKFLLHRYDVAYMKLLGSGVRQTISFNHIANSLLVLPPLAEQTRIAEFLDQKTAQIDQAIAQKERLIELLNERRQVMIHKAVTRGINPDAPMKNSGIEWIGEIPAHWEVSRLKYLFEEVVENTKTGKEELLSLRMNIGLVPHNDVSDIEITDANLIGYKVVKCGQMVMNRMRASIGLFGVSNQHGLVSPDYAVYEISEDISPNYYLTLFKTTTMGTVFRLNSKGLGTGSSGFMRIYNENFGNIKIQFPPKEEQEAISEYIEFLNTKVESGISYIEAAIQKLQELKSTLINSAVTGKIRV